MAIEKYKKFLIKFAYFAIIIAAVYVVLNYGLPMLSPFVIGAVLAYLLRLPVRFLSRKLRLSYKGAAILVSFLFFVIIGGLISLVGVKLVSWITGFVGRLPDLYQTYAIPFFGEVMDRLEVLMAGFDHQVVEALSDLGRKALESVGQMLSSLSVTVVSLASGAATSLPGLIIKVILIIISTFFLSIDYEKIRDFLLRQMSEKTQNLLYEIKNYVAGTLWVCIRSYVLIMCITCVELAIGLSIIKVNGAVLIAVLISIFDILPVLGTGGIMIPWTILSLVRGELRLALGLAIIYIAVTVIRNIIEPKIVGGQLGLHPIVTLSSMFLGVQLLGVIGLFGFPIGLSLLCHLNKRGMIHIIK